MLSSTSRLVLPLVFVNQKESLSPSTLLRNPTSCVANSVRYWPVSGSPPFASPTRSRLDCLIGRSDKVRKLNRCGNVARNWGDNGFLSRPLYLVMAPMLLSQEQVRRFPPKLSEIRERTAWQLDHAFLCNSIFPLSSIGRYLCSFEPGAGLSSWKSPTH